MRGDNLFSFCLMIADFTWLSRAEKKVHISSAIESYIISSTEVDPYLIRGVQNMV